MGLFVVLFGLDGFDDWDFMDICYFYCGVNMEFFGVISNCCEFLIDFFGVIGVYKVILIVMVVEGSVFYVVMFNFVIYVSFNWFLIN